jgi:hypothetical protein
MKNTYDSRLMIVVIDESLPGIRLKFNAPLLFKNYPKTLIRVC